MPLESPDKEIFSAAVGYAELGMLHEANAELEKLEPFNRTAPEVLALRVGIYQALKKWELMLEVAQRLNEFAPNDVQWMISFAYATRRAVSIEAAKEILLDAQTRFPNEPVILFNLACYYCQLNDVQTAKDYLKKTFAIDPTWRLEALEDEDLKTCWDLLGHD